MNPKMINEPKYIDLYGRVRKVIYKNSNVIVFIFSDESFGDLYCKAGRETIFYRKTEKYKKYHLQVVLKGIKSETKHGEFLYNHIFIKRVFPL
ncbi:hypothetical protein KOY_02265 [Bacillus cereus VDM021]|nr:hypothetical protein KOY_02265 [Bacillus cereus VDM021]